jgi:hypothetical protein
MFLTLEDPRARIKGSRDPLGVQPAWSWCGRRLVGNLTTVTRSVREFTVQLLGRWVAELLIESERIEESEVVSTFLRVEQLCAYARVMHYDASVRGITHVRRFLDQPGNRLTISDERRYTILTDQRLYGIWGLFTVAGRASGLLQDGPIGLTPLARQFVDANYAPQLAPVQEVFLKLAAKGGQVLRRRDTPILRELGKVLRPELTNKEVQFYKEHLRDRQHAGGGAADRQASLATLIRDAWAPGEPLDRSLVRRLAEHAQELDPALAQRLRRMDRLESLLAPAEAAFGLVIARDGQEVVSVADELRSNWGKHVPYTGADWDLIQADLQTAVGQDLTACMNEADRALGDGDYAKLIGVLLDWNRLVMAGRGAAPWVRLGENGRLSVRFRGDEPWLPGEDELHEYWRNPYFIDSLADIVWQLEKGADPWQA